MPNNLMQSNFPRERVIRRFREWIDHGRLITGERLPAEGSIAVEFGVSRGTVRAALKQLEEDGLLESRRHCGRVVAASATGAKLLAKSFMLISDIQPNPEVHAGDLPLGAMMMGIMTEATVAGLHPVVLGRAGLTDG
jgi:DNA-binding FadR family transcriptional regulator